MRQVSEKWNLVKRRLQSFIITNFVFRWLCRFVREWKLVFRLMRKRLSGNGKRVNTLRDNTCCFELPETKTTDRGNLLVDIEVGMSYESIASG